MDNNRYLRISEFSKLTGIKRDNLIFYDRIGLLKPEFRAENGYRYYSHHQIGTAAFVSGLRYIGVSIDEIKGYADKRRPENMLNLFSAKKEEIEKQIRQLSEIRDTMRLYMDMVEEVENCDTERIYIRTEREQPVFLGDLFRLGDYSDYVEASTEFYEKASEYGVNLNAPFGAVMDMEDLLKRRVERRKRFYLLTPGLGNAVRPAGRYVCGYMLGDYINPAPLYNRLLDYIEDNKLTIAGDAYEDYPLNEFTASRSEDYLLRIMIRIE